MFLASLHGVSHAAVAGTNTTLSIEQGVAKNLVTNVTITNNTSRVGELVIQAGTPREWGSYYLGQDPVLQPVSGK